MRETEESVEQDTEPAPDSAAEASAASMVAREPELQVSAEQEGILAAGELRSLTAAARALPEPAAARSALPREQRRLAGRAWAEFELENLAAQVVSEVEEASPKVSAESREFVAEASVEGFLPAVPAATGSVRLPDKRPAEEEPVYIAEEESQGPAEAGDGFAPEIEAETAGGLIHKALLYGIDRRQLIY